MTENVTIFFGKMGSGKTTAATRELIKAARAGETVWVNYPIKEFAGRKGDVLFCANPDELLYMKNGLFIIDEAYLYLNSRKWSDLKAETFLAFTHCRKRHMRVIIIAQSWKRIDLSIRELATTARCFSGKGIFGLTLKYDEYEIDESGEIIKNILEYTNATPGNYLRKKETFKTFDTDFIFEDPGGETKAPKWASAIGWRPSSSTL